MAAPASAAGCGPVPAEAVSHPDELAALTTDWKRGRPVRIVAIGSSSTQGIGASAPDKAYPARLAEVLKEKREGWTFAVSNLGVGGETAPATLERLRAVVKGDPDLIIWQVGTNDALKGGDPAAFRTIIERGVAAARAADVGLLLLDPQDFPKIENRDLYESYVREIRAVADEYGVPLFSRYALMRSWRGESEDRLLEMLSPDRFHMGDRGYECLAAALGATIDTALSRRRDVPPAMVSRERSLSSAHAPRPRRD